MGLLGAFIAGIIIGWFLHYIIAPATPPPAQPSTSSPQLAPIQSEAPKPPSITIEKLAPLPKEPRAATTPTSLEAALPATKAKPTAPTSASVISGGAASDVALSNVTAPARSAAAEKPVPPPVAAPPVAAPPAQPKAAGQSDRLQTINGIGPVYEKKLKAAGVQTFADLAQQTPERVVEIIAPKSWQNIDAAEWIAQAATLANS